MRRFASRRWATTAGIAALVLGVGAAGVAIAAPADSSPPRPLVSNHGDTKRATLFSYCWTHDGQGLCADGVPPDGPARPRVRFHPGDRVRVDLRYPAESFEVDGLVRPVDAVPVNRRQTIWRFRMPGRTTRSTNVILFSTYDRGDAASVFRAVIHPRSR